MRSIAVAFSVPALLLGWSTAARAQQIHELTVRPSAEPALAMPANVLRLVAEPPASPAPASPAPMTAPTVIPVADSAEPAGWRIWGRAEYIHWWYKDGSSPPLVTMTVGPDQVLPTLDRPTTAVLYGNTLDSKDHPGGRLTVGFALPCRDCGFELTGLLSGWRDNDFFVASGGIPILGRPFFDVSSGVPVPVVENVANPTIGANAALAGSVTISNPSRMYGLEGNCVCCWCEEPCGDYRVQLLYGVRYLAYNEDLKITEDLAAQDGSGQTFIVHDSFSA
ncbi:MAG: BBP7 family outer membrane beta-barrel protein, partial [Planctomycetia bacterium]|nr:BBP7 family outer membrane beta-barrel protein [Planctomycetia bacterium]